jgi:hypothetical protein
LQEVLVEGNINVVGGKRKRDQVLLLNYSKACSGSSRFKIEEVTSDDNRNEVYRVCGRGWSYPPFGTPTTDSRWKPGCV